MKSPSGTPADAPFTGASLYHCLSAAVFAAVALLGTATVCAQGYPSRPVVIINPFPGGATEIGARIY